MPTLDLLLRWLDLLSALVLRLGAARRNRDMLRVTRSGEEIAFRAGADPDAPLLAATPIGAAPPREVLARARFVVLEWPREKTITRTLTLPAQARDFLAGVVANRLDRLSPWPVGQILHGHLATPQADASRLTVRVLIAHKTDVDGARAALADMGLTVDRVVAAAGAAREPVVLWTRGAAQGDAASRRRMRLCVGGAIGAYVALCAIVVAVASLSASALQQEAETLAARAHALQKRADAAKNPAAVAALQPRERAWIWKETSTPIVALVDALSRAIPDGAFLESLALEAGRLRMTGLAENAPPLIDALEKSGRFFDARFSAPTTRAPDGKSFRFGIEAQLAAAAPKKGK
ncbi:PilN domain-containing protein [Methylosinus sp. Ce-a6]|uniref:PilN domain-containing protein n=1 Tax=Methylosinus sp. Ce-a6 TaxID=2172005 RepID=UPI0013597C2A|nr:PilN domain-containing protein [Methylosinus sp. Ce-a6]